MKTPNLDKFAGMLPDYLMYDSTLPNICRLLCGMIRNKNAYLFHADIADILYSRHGGGNMDRDDVMRAVKAAHKDAKNQTIGD